MSTAPLSRKKKPARRDVLTRDAFAELYAKAQTQYYERCNGRETGNEVWARDVDGRRIEMGAENIRATISYAKAKERILEEFPEMAGRLPRRAKIKYPVPFRDLPNRLQEIGIEKRQNDPDESWPCWDEVDDVSEMLVEVLEYEWGIDVQTRTASHEYKGKKWTTNPPEMTWSIYCPLEVTFKDDLDLDKMLARGREEALKDGRDCFHTEIKDLLVLLAESTMLGAALGVEIEWDLRLTTDSRRDIYERATWGTADGASKETDAIDALQAKMGKALERIYKAACRRCCKCLDDENEYRNSKEHIRELLMDDDTTLFDEEGNQV